MSDNKVVSRLVGVVGKPHGIKGYVYIRMFTDYPDTILSGIFLYSDEDCTVEMKVEAVRKITVKGQNRTIIKFFGIEDRSHAENIRSLRLYRKSESFNKLEKDTYWVDELIGCSVYFIKDKSFIGKITDVESYKTNDNLLIECNGEMITVPMIEEYIDSIIIKKKTVFLKKIPEYI